MKKINKYNYLNVLGEDFNNKDNAYKYFREKINEFIIPSTDCVIMTEETPIKQSQMIQLDQDYGSYSPEWEKRKSHGTGINEWCVIRNDLDGIKSIGLGFFRNKKENESKFSTILPESVTAQKIFTCFGPGKFNLNQILTSALRHEIRPQTRYFRDSFKNPNFCKGCEKNFYPEEMIVDHTGTYEFKDIVKEFFKAEGWKDFMIKSLYKESIILRIQESSPDDEFYPDSPRQMWQDFHKERAIFQMLCKTCHHMKTYAKKIKYEEE